MLVTYQNISKITEALELDKIVLLEEVNTILKSYENEETSFANFSKDLIVLMDKIAEEDFTDVLNFYSVPAERIIRTLKLIKEKNGFSYADELVK
mmetsp:Transcript_18456/g.17571  ORF Transcript_18456/g.17571 Transcript_18456/m.17571 type:complete len:95 (-) Transcript_18456:1409-1693(-)